LALPGSSPLGVLGRIIVKGRNKMRSYDKKLTDAGVRAAVEYMQSLCK
jgi:hypothetical protein